MLTGLGNIAALCTSRRVTICQEGNQFASVSTAAHELGHKSVFTTLYIELVIQSILLVNSGLVVTSWALSSELSLIR